MWRTPDGERTLCGAEAELFRQALGSVVEAVETFGHDDGWPFGIAAFDSLTIEQKLTVLAEVGAMLLRKDVACGKLTAVKEATVAAVFYYVSAEVQVEIDIGDDAHWRKLVIKAAAESGVRNLPVPTADDVMEWELLIQCLTDRILWDEDWADIDFFLDLDPDLARGMKKKLGIDNDYFTAVPPDPADVDDVRLELQKLIEETV